LEKERTNVWICALIGVIRQDGPVLYDVGELSAVFSFRGRSSGRRSAVLGQEKQRRS
jgi:hypothetical protein